MPHRIQPFMRQLSGRDLEDSLAYGAKIQAALPPGVTAIEDMAESYIFDFRRNRIDVQDTAGLASPPPGLPITGSVEANRAFLLRSGEEYVIFDRALLHPCSGWEEFLRSPRMYYPRGMYFKHPPSAHSLEPWTRVEIQVSCHEEEMMYSIARGGRVV